MFIVFGIFLSAGLSVILLTFGLLLLSKKSTLIFDKYPRKGLFYEIKYGIAMLVLRYLRNRIYHRNEKQLNTPERLADIDRPQKLSDDPQCYDVVSFISANSAGQKLFITLERRRRGELRAALYLWLPNEDLLCLPKLPDMMHFIINADINNNNNNSKGSEFHGCGFHIYPEKSMQTWRIKYNGDLRSTKNQKNQLVPIELDLQFSSSTTHFDYNRDLSTSVIADSIAREAWNEHFYNMLRNIDKILDKRTHYEQNGTISGILRYVKNAKEYKLELRSLRDHSFGTERCLSSIHRYVYFGLFLNDGTHIIAGNLSQPSFLLSSLKVGYICTPLGVYKPLTNCNFELYSYGEKGTPPKYQNFIVSTAEEQYFVQIKADDYTIRYVGSNWESKVYNQFVSCTVNGILGHGITEYLYRNNTGRPESVSSKDPIWYQRMQKFERCLDNLEPVVGDDQDFFF